MHRLGHLGVFWEVLYHLAWLEFKMVKILQILFLGVNILPWRVASPRSSPLCCSLGLHLPFKYIPFGQVSFKSLLAQVTNSKHTHIHISVHTRTHTHAPPQRLRRISPPFAAALRFHGGHLVTSEEGKDSLPVPSEVRYAALIFFFPQSSLNKGFSPPPTSSAPECAMSVPCI